MPSRGPCGTTGARERAAPAATPSAVTISCSSGYGVEAGSTASAAHWWSVVGCRSLPAWCSLRHGCVTVVHLGVCIHLHINAHAWLLHLQRFPFVHLESGHMWHVCFVRSPPNNLRGRQRLLPPTLTRASSAHPHRRRLPANPATGSWCRSLCTTATHCGLAVQRPDTLLVRRRAGSWLTATCTAVVQSTSSSRGQPWTSSALARS